MILGVSHLTWSVGSLDGPSDVLRRAGYVQDVLATDLPNDPAKRPYLRRYLPTHDIALFRPPAGPPVELVCHGPHVSGAGVRALLPSGALEPMTMGAAVSAGRIEALVMHARDRRSATALWREGLGYAEADGRLRSTAAMPAWRVDIHLADGAVEGRCLDDGGWTALALLTTDVDGDRDRLARLYGADLGEPFAMDVGPRAVRACVGRTAEGDLIELVQVAARGRQAR